MLIDIINQLRLIRTSANFWWKPKVNNAKCGRNTLFTTENMLMAECEPFIHYRAVKNVKYWPSLHQASLSHLFLSLWSVLVHYFRSVSFLFWRHVNKLLFSPETSTGSHLIFHSTWWLWSLLYPQINSYFLPLHCASKITYQKFNSSTYFNQIDC